jgi:hypothetical protein
MNQGSRTDRAMKSAQPFGFKEIGGITNLCLAAGRANWSLDPEQLGGERPLSLNLAHNRQLLWISGFSPMD